MLLFDAFLVLFIMALTIMGLRSGLIHESVTLLGLIAGLYVAGRYNEHLGPMLKPWLHTRGMSNLGAFVVLLLSTWLLMLILGAFVRGLLEGIRLGWIDNLAGGLLGLVKGLFVAELIVLILMAVPAEGIRNAVKDSWLGGWLASLAPDLLDLVPPVLRYWKPF